MLVLHFGTKFKTVCWYYISVPTYHFPLVITHNLTKLVCRLLVALLFTVTSGGERAEREAAIVVHKSIVRCVVTTVVRHDRVIARKLQAEPLHASIGVRV
jgi:hypothetical protein